MELRIAEGYGFVMEDSIERYRKNYIKEMRKKVGHAPLMVTGCGVIVENDKGEILLQKRRDNGCWAILGGSMEIGEKFVETARREVYEEAGIEIGELTLFGIYSGRIITYPNGDICFGTGISFKTTGYRGDSQNNAVEAWEHQCVESEILPDNINEADKQCIFDWTKGLQQVIVD